jgi:hypothetical protein
MSVSIGEVSSEFTVDPRRSVGDGGGGGGAGSASPAPAEEVKIEELRTIVRELLVEEVERYLRLAVER